MSVLSSATVPVFVFSTGLCTSCVTWPRAEDRMVRPVGVDVGAPRAVTPGGEEVPFLIDPG